MDSHYISSFINGFNPPNQYSANYSGNSANSLSTITSDEDENDFSDTVLRYINQMLMEEDINDKPCMFHDSLALQAAEESLYEVINEKYPSDSSIIEHHRHHQSLESPEESVSGNFSDFSSSNGSNYATSVTTNSIDSNWGYNIDFTEDKPSLLQATFPSNFVFQSHPTSSSSPPINNKMMRSFNYNYEYSGFSDSTLLLSKTELMLQFKRGVEEANKFLPINIFSSFPEKAPALAPALEVVTKRERDEREYEVELEDGRSKKVSAVFIDDEDDTDQLSELLDNVLIGPVMRSDGHPMCIFHEIGHTEEAHMCEQQPQKKEESKKSIRKQSYKNEVVELGTLLIQCAQAVSSDNRGSAKELLKEIRQHSLPFGSGSQRLAHCFANALEARLAGTGSRIYTSLTSTRTSTADMVRSYQMYMTAFPFHEIALIFANHSIMHLPSEPDTIHIIDFGIFYGFQWPPLIYRLSKRPGGPGKLRITGIDLPQRGFRPAERVQETGHRLAKYCKRFNVPFEYNGIAQKWETIRVEDLKIRKNEHVIVNCLSRLKNLADETVMINSPRDAVLRLIRKAKPDIFFQTTVNGCYNAPFFVTRFREALYHYTSIFDMLDTNIDAEDPMRLMYEKEFLGQEVTNIIACEGSERVERPETYKKWRVRNMIAGFRQLPLDHRLVEKLREKLRKGYHSDFMLDVDGNWMLQGWKGRVIYASSSWVPA